MFSCDLSLRVENFSSDSILDEREIAVSRRYTTQLLLQKGIDEIIKYADKAEFLDFSSAEDIFGVLEI